MERIQEKEINFNGVGGGGLGVLRDRHHARPEQLLMQLRQQTNLSRKCRVVPTTTNTS